jgi:ubiquinone/menaquinone biosynthesis C-methylase UbiE
VSQRGASDAVRARFEREARSFDAIYGGDHDSTWSRWFNRAFRKGIFERFEITMKECSDLAGRTVLDVGCGSGIYEVEFAKRGAKRVLGIDFSANMLESARARVRREGVDDVCELLLADFFTQPFSERFDYSIAMGVFDYLPDPAPFLEKMRRVSSRKVVASFPGHSRIRERLRKLRYKLSGKGDVFFYAEEDVRRLAAGAGFADFKLVHVFVSGSGDILVGDCGGR